MRTLCEAVVTLMFCLIVTGRVIEALNAQFDELSASLSVLSAGPKPVGPLAVSGSAAILRRVPEPG